MRQTAALVFAVTAGAMATAYAPQPLAAWAANQLPAGLHSQLKDPPLGLPVGSAQPDREHAEVEFLDPQQTTIPARSSAAVELRFRVADGLHINSHAPREKTLIPTRLAVVEENGVNVTAIDFPSGAVYTPAFAPQEKLSVYTGDFMLRAHITARPGEHLLHAVLRYQACDVNSCMPPRTLPIEIGILAK